ncbi:MAG: methionine--tRNA ligase [Succinivibrionaceae bacterium]|nr:methionine--tRNA ligase [Succinivibrionaceae bacterium]
MTDSKRKILITNALPYANGPIHLGHMLEHIQSDIFARFQRAMGNEVHYVCADDCHGTPVMIKAGQLGITPEELIAKARESHLHDLNGFLVSYDNYYLTHSEENRRLCERLYLAAQEKGLIKTRKISQFYDPKRGMFLPDRFIKGKCPRCGAPDQYGDNCEVCSATYSPTDLKDPYSVVSGATPELRESEHYFFDLPACGDFLHGFVHQAGVLPPEMANKLEEWFREGLQQWDISRDDPYFGFKIPGTDNKYFYVWLDAPVGYLASFEDLARREGIDFEEYLREGTPTQMYHFIGKDILYFHSLFWPAILHAGNMRLPTGIFVHGYVTVNGTKMSKSRGTFIKAATFLRHLHPETLRYYFASKLTPSVEDVDLSLQDFMAKINSDVVGKLVNLASRTAGFINKGFSGVTASAPRNIELMRGARELVPQVMAAYEARNYQEVVRSCMALADQANRYIAQEEPWKAFKDESQRERVQGVCTDALSVFRTLVACLSPILPELSARAAEFLGVGLSLAEAADPLLEHRIGEFRPLFSRIEQKDIDALIEESKEDVRQAAPAAAAQDEGEPLAPEISIDDFLKVDLRVATILSAEPVEESRKLIRLKVDLGPLGQREVLAGIRAAYKDPAALVGRQVVVVANLKPRKMKFGTSEGMVTAAGPGPERIFLLSPDQGAANGERVH